MKYHLQIFSTLAGIAKDLETNSTKKWTSFKRELLFLIANRSKLDL